METSQSGSTIYPKVGIWYRAETGHIHLSIEGKGLSTISPDPTSMRGHPHLYRKLAILLRDTGAAYPDLAGLERRA